MTDAIVIASSARYLAEAAHHAGYRVMTVDAFADKDTHAVATAVRRVPLTETGLAMRATEMACDELAAESNEIPAVVVGAGTDAHASLLERLNERLRLYGNSAEIFSICADPISFAKHLDVLGIARPPAANGAPSITKPTGVSGGEQVRLLSSSQGVAGDLYLPGMTISHLFVAAHGQFETIGIGTQWPATHNNSTFCYGGAINRAPLNQSTREQIEEITAKLTSHFALRGINSIDYLLRADRLFCLELNPRPSATMQLYEEDEPGYLFEAHIRSCQGILTQPPSNLQVRAHAIIYASRPWTVNDTTPWPAGACDIPSPGIVPPDAPLCSLRVAGATPEHVLSELNDKISSFSP